jgi:two-component system cell cycle response regulator DivK
MAGETILVVDDNLLNVKLARTVLVKAGYAVHTANDAAGALAQLELVVPQLIILDLLLPDIDGFELARQLKDDVRYRDIPIIAMTASGFVRDEERARLAGCDAFLPKPFEIDELLRTVECHLHLTN